MTAADAGMPEEYSVDDLRSEALLRSTDRWPLHVSVTGWNRDELPASARAVFLPGRPEEGVAPTEVVRRRREQWHSATTYRRTDTLRWSQWARLLGGGPRT